MNGRKMEWISDSLECSSQIYQNMGDIIRQEQTQHTSKADMLKEKMLDDQRVQLKRAKSGVVYPRTVQKQGTHV